MQPHYEHDEEDWPEPIPRHLPDDQLPQAEKPEDDDAVQPAPKPALRKPQPRRGGGAYRHPSELDED